jgi:transcriptional antiterminator RfaH
MDWYLLRTKPREEWRAKQHLENQSFTTYLPVLVRKSLREEPLFPGYIFLGKPDEQVSLHTISSTRGVLNFVRFGIELAIAPSQLIEEVQAIEQLYRDVPKFTPGQAVECKAGPFAGLQAIFQAENGQDRCVILLKILNAERSIVVSQADLKAV